MSCHNSAHEPQYTTRKMPGGKLHTDFEKGRILAYKRKFLSIKDILHMLIPSRKRIWTFLNHEYCAQKSKETRKGTIFDILQNVLSSAAHQMGKYAPELQEALNSSIFTRYEQQIIKSCPHLKYVNIKQVPSMKMDYMAEILKWARRNISKSSHFVKGIALSDKKKFNCYGSDSFARC